MSEVLLPIGICDPADILGHKDHFFGIQLLRKVMNVDRIDQSVVIEKTDVVQECSPAKVFVVMSMRRLFSDAVLQVIEALLDIPALLVVQIDLLWLCVQIAAEAKVSHARLFGQIHRDVLDSS